MQRKGTGSQVASRWGGRILEMQLEWECQWKGTWEEAASKDQTDTWHQRGGVWPRRFTTTVDSSKIRLWLWQWQEQGRRWKSLGWNVTFSEEPCSGWDFILVHSQPLIAYIKSPSLVLYGHTGQVSLRPQLLLVIKVQSCQFRTRLFL